MQATVLSFLKLLDGTKQFSIPIYQRTYSWRCSDCQQLWDDILRVAQNDHIPTHFIGSIVYVGRGPVQASITEMLVIDGQQRLTTLFLLLAALAEALETRSEEQSKDITATKLRNQYLFNSYENDEKYYKLVLTKSDRETLNAILERQEEPQTVSPRIQDNFQFFRERISQCEISPALLFRGIYKLTIVDIALDLQDNPQLIFESLNSTGLDLSESDLIRNYVLMGLDQKEQEKLYKKYWYPMEQSFGQTQNIALFNRFMRDFLTLRTGSIPNVNEVYARFKIYHQDKMHVPMEQLIGEIYQYSKYFTCMVLGFEKNIELKHHFENLRVLDVNVVYPFLLEVYAAYEQQRLSHTDFVAVLKLIESYVFRRMICGMYANGLNRVFATLSKEIDKEHYLESLQVILLQKSGSARFPRDEEFQAAFVVKDIYNFHKRRYLFSQLENYKWKEFVNVGAYTIEHILPQNPNLSAEWQEELGPHWQEVQERYLHTIGNLTLTGYNPEMSDRPFREKRDMDCGFVHSKLSLNNELSRLEHWNAEEIEKRARRLAALATEIWSIPVLSPEQRSKYAPQVQNVPLVEVVGPAQHPLAGLVPEGFKIVPLNDKRFYYYRLVDGVWIQYGNGKYPWFRNTWKKAGIRVRDFAQKDIKPLGVGGKPVASSDVPEPDQDNDDADEGAA